MGVHTFLFYYCFASGFQKQRNPFTTRALPILPLTGFPHARTPPTLSLDGGPLAPAWGLSSSGPMRMSGPRHSARATTSSNEPRRPSRTRQTSGTGGGASACSLAQPPPRNLRRRERVAGALFSSDV